MLKNLFKLDLRSLALYRIVVGLILLFDFFNRFKLIDAFYSDNGILSRHDLIQNIEIEWKFTLLNIVGSPVFAYTLAAAGIVASIGIIKGFKTRLSTFVAWILLYSFQNRFPLVNHGGDNLLRLLTFFMLFLPVNQVASLDKFFGPFDFENIKTKDFNVFKVSNLLIFTQIFLMYFFTFFYKWDPSWFDR